MLRCCIFCDDDRCVLVYVVVLCWDDILFNFAKCIGWWNISNSDRRWWKWHQRIDIRRNVNWRRRHDRRDVAFDSAIDLNIRIYKRWEKTLNSLLRAVTSDRWSDQTFAWNIIQDRAIVTALIFILFSHRSLLDAFFVLLVLSIGAFQLEYL